jgi:hypothetical protein
MRLVDHEQTARQQTRGHSFGVHDFTLSTSSSHPRSSLKDMINAAHPVDASFRPVRSIDNKVPLSPGVYAIRIIAGSTLPVPFGSRLGKPSTRLIYVGKATSLKSRMLGNELRGRGHGTFFRSIGAVLGYRPRAGSLTAMVNKNNYSFEKPDRDSIVEWINNIEVSWSALPLVDVPATEAALILRHTPLLNLAGNPIALVELKELRVQCRQITAASTGSVEV